VQNLERLKVMEARCNLVGGREAHQVLVGMAALTLSSMGQQELPQT
jgi:hypothetical protein